MKLTESELRQIIEEELNEIFGLSKKDKLMDRILSVDDSKTKKELKGLSAKALAAIWDHVRTLARSKKTGVSHTKYTGGTGVKSINTRSKNAISKIVSGAPGTSPEQHDIIIKNVIAQIKKSGIMLEQLPGYAPGRTRPGDMALFSRDRSGGGGDKRRVQLNLTALSDETAQHILAGLNQEFSAYEFVSGAGQPGQPGDQPDQPGAAGLSKEAPLSVTKRQKDVRVGAQGQKETPLVMQLQKIGMSQQSAQQISKRIGQYLQQRKIPVAEGVINEDTVTNQVRKSMLGKMQSLMKDKASEEAKDVGAEMVMAAHSLAKKGDVENFRKTILKWAKKGKLGKMTWISRPEGQKEFAEVSQEEITKMMHGLLKHDLFQKYHKAGAERRQAKAAGKAQRRGDIRGVGKGVNKAADTIIGKIISRFVSDNQQLLDKDPALQGIFDDPKKFNKLRKSVTNLLARQMQRRGYDAAEIQKLIGKKPPENMGEAHEELVAECVREMQNILSTTTKLSRWKVLSGVK